MKIINDYINKITASMEEFPHQESKKAQLRRITIHSDKSFLIDENSYNSQISDSSNYFNENNITPFCEFYFLIQGVKLKQNITKVLKSCPLIAKVLLSPKSKTLTSSPIIIKLPDDVTEECIESFYSYITSPSLVSPSSVISVLILAEYFENTILSHYIIQNDIFRSLNHKTAVNSLVVSLKKMRSEESNEKKSIWIQLFDFSKNCIMREFDRISIDDIVKLHQCDNNLFFEMLQTYCYSTNCCINDNNGKCELLMALEKIFKCNNLLIVLDTLYKDKFNPNSFESLVTSSIPKIIELRKDYKEYDIGIDDNDKNSVLVSSSFNEKECQYNISIIPSTGNFFLYSMLYLNDCKGSGDSFITSFSRYTNYSFKRENYQDTNTKINKVFLHIKVDYTFTSLANHIINHIDQYWSSFHLISNNLTLIVQLLLSFKAKAVNQNILLTVIMDWLSNRSNSTKENIIALSEHINWRDIKIELICEFYIKYSLVLKKTLVNTLMTTLKENKMDKIVSHMANALKPNIISSLNSNIKNMEITNNIKKIKICSSVSTIQLLPNQFKLLPEKKKTKIDEEKTRTRGLSYLSTTSTQFPQSSRSKKSESINSRYNIPVTTKPPNHSKNHSKDSIMTHLINNLLSQTSRK